MIHPKSSMAVCNCHFSPLMPNNRVTNKSKIKETTKLEREKKNGTNKNQLTNAHLKHKNFKEKLQTAFNKVIRDETRHI